MRLFIATLILFRTLFWIGGADLFERSPTNAMALTTSIFIAVVFSLLSEQWRRDFG